MRLFINDDSRLFAVNNSVSEYYYNDEYGSAHTVQLRTDCELVS